VPQLRPMRMTLLVRAILTAALLFSAAFASAAEPQLAGVIFEGASHYSPEDLLPLYRADLGKSLDDAMQARIAAGLIARYDADGFLRPTVEPVTHESNPGVLIFNVKEPAVRRVAVSGKEYVTNARFWQQLDDLKAQAPLARSSFHQWLARVNEADGMFVTGTVTPFGTAGADYIAQLHVAPNPISGMLHIDNQAPDAIGNEVMQGMVSYRFANALAGQLSAAVAVATDVDKLKFASIAGTHGLDDTGHAFEWSASQSKSKLSSIPDDPNDYERSRFTAGLRSPLYRGTTGTVDAWTLLQLYDVDQFDSAGETVSQERLRSAALGVTTSLIGSATRRHDVALSITRGFDAFGARESQPAGTPQPDIDFLRWILNYRLTQQIGQRWTTSLGVQGQWSADDLPESERFYIGGRQLGGAFDPASVTGDRGAGARVEVAHAESIPHLPLPVQSYLYADYGLVRSNERDAPADSAASLGAGLRMSFHTYSGSLEVATPLREPNSNPLASSGTRFFFALTKTFL
jgi:hemolysin activation/secretion protein